MIFKIITIEVGKFGQGIFLGLCIGVLLTIVTQVVITGLTL